MQKNLEDWLYKAGQLNPQLSMFDKKVVQCEADMWALAGGLVNQRTLTK